MVEQKKTLGDMIPEAMKEKMLQNYNQTVKDFKEVFDTPTGKRVLQHLSDKVIHDKVDTKTPYEVHRKDACINLVEVYIKGILNLTIKEKKHDKTANINPGS